MAKLVDDLLFEMRWQRSGRDLLSAFTRIYGDRPDFVARLKAQLKARWIERPDVLKTPDLTRDLNPDWFLSEKAVGYVFYVDRFAIFQENAATGDRRNSGSFASLAGLEAALETGNAEAIDASIQRMLMGVALICSFGGYLGNPSIFAFLRLSDDGPLMGIFNFAENWTSLPAAMLKGHGIVEFHDLLGGGMLGVSDGSVAVAPYGRLWVT